MKRIFLTLFVGALAWAQAQQQEGPRQAIIDVRYADVNRLVTLLRQTFASPGTNISGDPTLHVVTISGSPDTVAAVTSAVKRFDVPPQPEPDVELTVYLISGLAQGQGDDLPQELASTIKQLHGLFAYKAYKLVDSMMLRGRPGSKGQVDGTSPVGRYTLSYAALSVSMDTPRTVHINSLNFQLTHEKTQVVANPPPQHTERTSETLARISADLDLREGQKTVVGKSSVNSAGDAVILVIVPRVADESEPAQKK